MAWSKAFQSVGVLDELKRSITSLREQWRGTRRENERLLRENEQLRQQRQDLERERERLREENEQLRRQLEEAQRASKRQTAPFSRRTRTPHPRRPGRKPGAAYGTRHSKPVPDHIDEVIAVSARDRCACGGALDVEKIESQYQHDIVRKTVWKRFDVSICRCRVCHQRVHGRDLRQTSDAFGAAGVQLGPDALALAVTMNKRLGLPHADVVTVRRDGCGPSMNRSTVCRAVTRVARRGEATWHALRDPARRSLVNAIDETGGTSRPNCTGYGSWSANRSPSVTFCRAGASSKPRRSWDPTTTAAERAIRALIGARKNWGGNRTPNGARAQAILTSLLQTAQQQGKGPFDVMVELLCCRDRHTILDLVPLNRAPLQDSSPAPPTGRRLRQIRVVVSE